MGPINSSSLSDIEFADMIANMNATSTVTASTFVITSAMIQEHTLQAQIELDYVTIGTEVMNSALTALDNALTITQGALDQLSSIQNLHNQLSITASSTFPLNFTTTANQTVTLTSTNSLSQTTTFTFLVHDQASFVSAYEKLASAYYGHTIKPIFKVVIPAQSVATAFTPAHSAFSTNIVSGHEAGYSVFLDMLKSAKHDLSALIAQLSAITKPGDTNTLYSQLKTVENDFPDFTNFSAVQQWAIDNYGGSTGAAIANQGKFQQDITNAITAAESTNTSQQESVRRYMFVFEQYCQSAAAVLKALDDLFDKISRGISG